MKTKLIAMLMVAGSTMFAGPRVFVGLNVGVPVAPVAVVAPAPVGYAPGYVWVGGYYNFVGGRRVWNAGYWRAPVGVGFNHGFVGRGYARGFRR